MGDVLAFSLQLMLGIALPIAILRFDLRRLRGDALARAWPDSSVWSAVVAFGPLCLPVHFVRTRRSLSGVAWGMLALAACVAASAGASALMAVVSSS